MFSALAHRARPAAQTACRSLAQGPGHAARRGVAAFAVSQPDERVARVTMGAAPVNTMNLEFIQELTATIQEVEADKKINAMILDSSCKVSLRHAPPPDR